MGARNHAIQTRPTWMPGKIPAQMTAKIVIASAARLIEVRHFCAEQKQDRGDQRAGVADTDPEHEVGDVPRPADRMIESPHTDAGGNLIAEAEEAESRRSSHVIVNATHHQRGAVLFDDAGNVVR